MKARLKVVLPIVMSLLGLVPVVVLRAQALPFGPAPPLPPTSVPTATPLPPITLTRTRSPTLALTPTNTPTPTPTPTATATATPTSTPLPTGTPTSAPTATPAPSPTEAPVAAASAATDSGGWQEWAHGVATYYNIPGGTMRNGEPLDLNGLTCAVDASAWAELNGKQVRIRKQDGSDEGFIARVTDTGNLTAAGCFSVDASTNRVTRYSGTGECQHIVVDIPQGTFQTYLDSGTTAVIVEVQAQ